MSLRVLPEAQWRADAAAHRARLDELVGPYLERRAAGSSHPVIDFLFTYYGHKPAQLRRWHPGYGVALAGAAEYEGARGYHRVALPGDLDANPSTVEPGADHDSPAGDRDSASGPGAFTADPAYLARRRETIEFIVTLLRATASRPAQLSCFGLHEWAMVYRTDDVRHQQVPLRLGRAGTDEVVESMSLRCTHYDAFRFFTPDAVGRNIEPLTRADQVSREQPGCLHANMDLYKWGFATTPLIRSELLLDCFELAYSARELDMRASPYDLSRYGYDPVRIETPSGRAEYVRRQSEIAERACTLRARLLEACLELLARAPDVRQPAPGRPARSTS
ncbi:3-methyladenine DNA glycosylase [Nocardia sp. NPDC057440]|uniref:3-methyladenine DNA glycosylase n=1 Tax=Nocardia sp. NPDC057440 TaxID=3346134 RepID=UPI00366AD41E